MPGIFIVSDQMPIGQAIDELLLIITVTTSDEWVNRIVYLPL